jgi:uncharacterized membrane protein YbhN (UPF0104 family)
MKTKKIIPILVIMATLVLLIFYIKNNVNSFKQLTIANPLNLILLSIIILIALYLNGITLKTLMKPFKIKLKSMEAFQLSLITNFYNLITPFRGGAAARAIYLKKKYNFPYVNFLATLSAIYLLIFLVSAIIGLITLITLKFNLIIFLLFTAIIISTLAIIIFSPKIKLTKNKWLNRFIKLVNGWHLIKNNKRIIIITIIISILQILLTAINNIIAYQIFNISLTLTQALFIAAITNLSIIVAITPGNLGIGDAINVFSANLIGIPLTQAIAAAILLRAVNLIVIFILGPIASYKLMKNEKMVEKNIYHQSSCKPR